MDIGNLHHLQSRSDGARDAEVRRGHPPGRKVGMISQRIWIAALAGIAAPLALSSNPAHAQALPTPMGFVSHLDLECYRTPGPALNKQLTLSHLNPVLRDELHLPPHLVKIQELPQPF